MGIRNWARVTVGSIWIATCWLLASGAVAGPTTVILDQPVRVAATLQDPEENGGACLFAISIEYGDQRIELQTFVLISADTGSELAWEHLRRTIGWKDGYLFVLLECGAGNAWKCGSEAVFMIRGGRLVGLGSLLARGPTGSDSGDQPGTSYWNGEFHDINADFEGNDLTCHAGAPRFEVLLNEHGGTLIVDAERTWDMNRNLYDANWKTIQALWRRGTPENFGTQMELLLSNAVLSKYCSRPAELATTLAEARLALPRDVMQAVETELAKVEPGALPRTSRLVVH
jgi:hypothetical protein